MPKASFRKAPVPSRNGHGKHPITAVGHNRLEQSDPVERRIANLQKLLSQLRPVPEEWLWPTDSNHRPITAKLVSLVDVEPESVEWLWPQRIALGKLTLLVGVPGLGKSLITAYLAARTSVGGPWQGAALERQTPHGVVLMSCEDGLADTIQPRLVAAGADLQRINALVGAEYKQPGRESEEVSIDLKRHLSVIEHAVKATPDCGLLILDPISGYLAGIDSHKDGEVRPLLAKLAAMAEKHRIAIVAVAHMNKSDTQAAIHRASGSTAFVAAARAVWGVVEDREDESGDRRLLLPIKNNLGDDRTGLAYSIIKKDGEPAPVVCWEPELVRIRIDDAMGTTARKGPEPTKRNEAGVWLKAALAAGRRLAAELFAEAKAAGIAPKTLKAAKKHLGVIPSQVPVLGPWFWELPLEALVDPVTLTRTSKTTKPSKEKDGKKARGLRSPSSPSKPNGENTRHSKRGRNPSAPP